MVLGGGGGNNNADGVDANNDIKLIGGGWTTTAGGGVANPLPLPSLDDGGGVVDPTVADPVRDDGIVLTLVVVLLLLLSELSLLLLLEGIVIESADRVKLSGTSPLCGPALGFYYDNASGRLTMLFWTFWKGVFSRSIGEFVVVCLRLPSRLFWCVGAKGESNLGWLYLSDDT